MSLFATQSPLFLLLILLSAGLPLLFAWFALTLYGFLSQSSWSNQQKEMVSDAFVIVAAFVCALATSSMTGDIAVFLAPIEAIGTYYFGKESALLKKWSLILQAGLFVIQNGKFSLFGTTLPPLHAAITEPEISVMPLRPTETVMQASIVPPVAKEPLESEEARQD